jgi:hypothetical protein
MLNYKSLPDDETTSNTPPRPTRTKIKSSKRKPRKRSIQTFKFATEEELAHHVQTVFSGDLEEFLVDTDMYEVSSNDEKVKKLQKHPALVLNADFQVRSQSLISS